MKKLVPGTYFDAHLNSILINFRKFLNIIFFLGKLMIGKIIHIGNGVLKKFFKNIKLQKYVDGFQVGSKPCQKMQRFA